MSERSLSDGARTFLEDLPEYYREEPNAEGVLDPLARELARIAMNADQLRLGMFPQNADDALGFLALWETLFLLPVAPANQTIQTRREKVLALTHRPSGAGSGWVTVMTQGLGTANWSYIETVPYRVDLTLPFAPGTYEAEAARGIARRITPAHLQIGVVGGQGGGFLVGVSAIGVDSL